jgi:hypothetical protein
MNNTGFLKEAGAFLLTFILGTLSMHGILNYLITDAGNLITKGENTLPVISFLILYAAIPVLVVAIWRYWYSHRKISKYFDSNNKFIGRYFVVEKVVGVAIISALVIYSIYAIRLFAYNHDVDPLLQIAIWLLVLALVGILLIGTMLINEYIVSTGALKLKRPDKHSTIYPSVRHSFIEIILILLLWLTVFTVFMVNPAYSVLFSKDHQKVKVQNSFKEPLGLIKSLDTLQSINNSIRGLDMLSAATANNKAALPKEQQNNLEEKIDSLLIIYNDTISNRVNGAISSLNTYYKKLSDSVVVNDDQANIKPVFASIDIIISVLKNKYEKIVEDTLVKVLKHAQPLYKLLIAILLLYAIINWFVISHINRLVMFNSNKKEIPKPLPEIEFTKFYIMLLLVMLAPIFKTLNKKDIQFNKPLWTFGQPSVYNNSPGDKAEPIKNHSHTVEFNIFPDFDTLGLYTKRKIFYDSIALIFKQYNSGPDSEGSSALTNRIDSLIEVVTFHNVFNDTTQNLRTSISSNYDSIIKISNWLGSNSDSTRTNSKKLIKVDSIFKLNLDENEK